MKSDLDIAQEAPLRRIVDVAEEIGISEDELELYGPYKAKVSLGGLDKLADRPQGRYIEVTAINPTPLGEGKTVTTVGLGQALKHIGNAVTPGVFASLPTDEAFDLVDWLLGIRCKVALD